MKAAEKRKSKVKRAAAVEPAVDTAQSWAEVVDFEGEIHRKGCVLKVGFWSWGRPAQVEWLDKMYPLAGEAKD